MPGPDSTFGWQEAVTALAIITVVAFLVTWVVTDVLHVRRTPYVAVLSLVVAALSAGYLVWSGTSLGELVTSGWRWGLVAGVVTAVVLTPLLSRLPRLGHAHGGRLAAQLGWEGIVYGTAEAVLLATLPVLAAWQAMADAGWTDGAWAKVGSGALAVAAALLVILVHHLGYEEFRPRAARRMLAGALGACGLQALAFLLTGNVLAPIVAHILLHGQLVFRGDEMPPASRPAKLTIVERTVIASRRSAKEAVRTGS